MINIPYSKFICPDGETCEIEKCLERCRIEGDFSAGRCLSHRTLTAISEQRKWRGTPSATQLLGGIREAYLKITKDYPLDPQSSIFALFGTGCHAFLESYLENEKMVVEKRLTDPTGTYSGQFDCYDGKRKILYDVKTYGSFKTAKLLGLVKNKEVMYDENGKVRKYRNGKTMYKTWFSIGHRGVFDVAVQLNAYRIMVENAGYPVEDMQVEVFTRDAGTFSARDRGIFTNAQLVRIGKISDHWIQKFFLTKAKRLKEAIEKKELPPVCSYRERWGDRKCEGYCPVWMHCDYGREIHNNKKGE